MSAREPPAATLRDGRSTTTSGRVFFDGAELTRLVAYFKDFGLRDEMRLAGLCQMVVQEADRRTLLGQDGACRQDLVAVARGMVADWARRVLKETNRDDDLLAARVLAAFMLSHGPISWSDQLLSPQPRADFVTAICRALPPVTPLAQPSEMPETEYDCWELKTTISSWIAGFGAIWRRWRTSPRGTTTSL